MTYLPAMPLPERGTEASLYWHILNSLKWPSYVLAFAPHTFLLLDALLISGELLRVWPMNSCHVLVKFS